jgi:quinol monooxygenase YgiN
MIVIYAGTITMDPEVRDKYLALRIEQIRLYRAQPGVLGYAITADAVDPSVVNVFECYESEEALAAIRPCTNQTSRYRWSPTTSTAMTPPVLRSW